MPAPVVNIQELIDAVDRAKSVKDSVLAFIAGVGPQIQAAVTAALQADDAADQGSVDVANAAIAAKVKELQDASTELSQAITSTPAPTTDPVA